MDASEIRRHWTEWARQYGADVRATTRAGTPKVLEIDALTRHLRAIRERDAAVSTVLEVGCGNGVNCLALAKAFPDIRFHGLDFVAEMIQAATEQPRTDEGIAPKFFVGDVLDLAAVTGLERRYDVVFTDRCLINLSSLALQERAITELAGRVRGGGHLLLIENSMTTYGNQNRCREILGLPARTPASFNLFFDEGRVRQHAASLGLELAEVEDFSSLHDLLLYVLVPAVNGGSVDYEHPLVKAAAMLSVGVAATERNAFGPFGQNRLFHWRKPN